MVATRPRGVDTTQSRPLAREGPFASSRAFCGLALRVGVLKGRGLISRARGDRKEREGDVERILGEPGGPDGGLVQPCLRQRAGRGLGGGSSDGGLGQRLKLLGELLREPVLGELIAELPAQAGAFGILAGAEARERRDRLGAVVHLAGG